MRKGVVALLAAVVASSGLWVGTAGAIPLSDAEYEMFAGDPLGVPIYTAGSDLGYFIWADDAARTSWHIRWSGDTNTKDTANTTSANYYFSGHIYLTGLGTQDTANTFEGYDLFSWDRNDALPFHSDQTMAYTAWANVFEDGIDFTIAGDAVGALAFDLHIDPSGTDYTSPTPIADFINIGADGEHPGSEDFRVAAPVPEPGTMILLGSGLLGLAGLGRKKILRRA